MKLLGLTCGRKMGNSEILIKEAFMGAEEVGVIDLELIRLHDLKLKPCVGCEKCVESAYGGGTGECVIKNDDMSFFVRKFKECDGLIISFPVYFLRPPGYLLTMNDRMAGLSMKFSKDGTGKDRVAGLLSVGGTNWVSLSLSQITTWLHPLQVNIVDQLQVTFSARAGQVLLDQEAIERARKLGRNVAEAMGKKVGEVKFMGDESGQCPVCHSDVLLVRRKVPRWGNPLIDISRFHLTAGSSVECAICGSRGDLKLNGKEITVSFYEEDVKKSRWSKGGVYEHVLNIQELHKMFEQNENFIKQKIEKYKSLYPFSKPS